MGTRRLLWFVGLVTLVWWNPACSDSPYIFGRCSVTADCRTWYNFLGGTVCTDGYCLCHDPSDEICCPDGGQDCAWDAYECRSELICQGGIEVVKIAPGGACTADEQCREPLDKRCGAPVCRKGACGYEVGPGEFIANQFPGDCRINYCDFDGEVQWAPDTSDPPIDLNDCTFTGCVGSDPSMLVADDGTPCVSGFCVAGRCVECSEVLGAIFNCGGSSLCDWEECVPSYCKNGVKSPGETDTDCGGPHCRRCDTGSTCFISSDCASGVCSDNACKAATHNDGIQNGNESGPDCGYLGGPLYACEDGQGCNTPFDCISGVCYVGVCQPSSCLDDRLNGTETKTDCGGSCPPCP